MSQLSPHTKASIAARVPPQRHPGAVLELFWRRIVHQGHGKKLGGFIIGKGIAIKIVGEIELADKGAQGGC